MADDALNPAERLNRAAELLGMPERIPPECGQIVWADVQSKILLALAERAAAVIPAQAGTNEHKPVAPRPSPGASMGPRLRGDDRKRKRRRVK